MCPFFFKALQLVRVKFEEQGRTKNSSPVEYSRIYILYKKSAYNIVALDSVSVVVEITIKMEVAFFERLLPVVVGRIRPARPT